MVQTKNKNNLTIMTKWLYYVLRNTIVNLIRTKGLYYKFVLRNTIVETNRTKGFYYKFVLRNTIVETNRTKGLYFKLVLRNTIENIIGLKDYIISLFREILF